MNNKQIEKIFKSRPHLDKVKWQLEALEDKAILSEPKLVIAAGTSSGKTLEEIMAAELFYMNKKNSKKITLIIPSAQTNLRSNFDENLEFFKPTFKYKVCKSCEDLKQAVKDKIQVIIVLPQTANLCIDSLPKVERFILDEAHIWYYAKTIKQIIKKTKPAQQRLLTGSPSIFNLKGGFHMHYVPVMDLYDEGRIANTEVHVVSSYYDFKEIDYNADNNLTLSARAKSRLADKRSFEKVILGMMRKLKNPIKGLKDVNRLTKDVAGRFFNHLDKTIIWAASIKQANKFAEILRTYKGLENAVLVSHSKNDDDSILMDKFKEDDSIRILVSVNRGRMGWSYTELFHAIDFTMTRNLDSILQMMARLFRVSKVDPKKRKYFYKVCNSKDAGYYTIIMKGVLLLLDREWYSKFNGRNFNDMRIPVTVPRRPNPNREPNCKPKGRKRTVYNYEMIDLPLDMEFFNTVYAKQDDMFSTVAWTTISKVRKELGMKVQESTEEVLERAKSFSSYLDFTNDQSLYNKIANRRLINKVRKFYGEKTLLNENSRIAKAKQLAKQYSKDNFTLFRKENKNDYSYLNRKDPKWINSYFKRNKDVIIPKGLSIEEKVNLRQKQALNILKQYKDYNTFRKSVSNTIFWRFTSNNSPLYKIMLKHFNLKELPGSKRKIVATNIKTGNKKTFNSIAAAARFLKVHPPSVSNVLRNKSSNSKGYTFKYA